MKPATTLTPPPARRHRSLPVEPLIFAVLLMALTVGINLATPGDDTAHDSAKTTPTEIVHASVQLR